jgi:hypothetical protein
VAGFGAAAVVTARAMLVLQAVLLVRAVAGAVRFD